MVSVKVLRSRPSEYISTNFDSSPKAEGSQW